MSKYYLINEDFFVPLKDGMEDSISLKEGDILEVKFYDDDRGCMLKLIDTDYFYDSHLYHEFMVVNSFIFTDITKSILREKKLNKIIKKRS